MSREVMDTKYLTVVYRGVVPGDEARELLQHPKVSASSWSHAMHDRDAALAAPQGEPTALQFPTMLRKMWTGSEVQQWLDEQGPLYTAPQPAAPQGEPTEAQVLTARAALCMASVTYNEVRDALRAVFAVQPATPSVPQGEPAAWMMVNRNHPTIGSSLQWTPPLDWHITWEAHPLYTTPPPAAPSVPADPMTDPETLRLAQRAVENTVDFSVEDRKKWAARLIDSTKPAAPSVPAGWRLVPVEPTAEMLSALEAAMTVWVQEIGETSDVYRAMVGAAPKAPSGEAVCKKCGADRLREPCKGSLMDCGFTGVAQSTSSGGEASNGKA